MGFSGIGGGGRRVAARGKERQKGVGKFYKTRRAVILTKNKGAREQNRDTSVSNSPTGQVQMDSCFAVFARTRKIAAAAPWVPFMPSGQLITVSFGKTAETVKKFKILCFTVVFSKKASNKITCRGQGPGHEQS